MNGWGEVSNSFCSSEQGGCLPRWSVCPGVGVVCLRGCLPGECLPRGMSAQGVSARGGLSAWGSVWPEGVCSGTVPPSVGVSAQRVVSAQGGVCPGGCLPVGKHPPVNRITGRCKNITLP